MRGPGGSCEFMTSSFRPLKWIPLSISTDKYVSTRSTSTRAAPGRRPVDAAR